MGSRGPAPTPLRLQLARGETRPSRLHSGEPRASLTNVRMPREMDPVAKVVWRRVLATEAPGVIRAVDEYLLRMYCESVSRYADLVRLYARSGPVVRGARGQEVVRNPLSSMIRAEVDQIRLVGRELGLSPAARAGLHIEISNGLADETDPLGLGPSTQQRFAIVESEA